MCAELVGEMWRGVTIMFGQAAVNGDQHCELTPMRLGRFSCTAYAVK
jgi:hypothetical protein